MNVYFLMVLFLVTLLGGVYTNYLLYEMGFSEFFGFLAICIWISLIFLMMVDLTKELGGEIKTTKHL